jgi:hypothetical protein
VGYHVDLLGSALLARANRLVRFHQVCVQFAKVSRTVLAGVA